MMFRKAMLICAALVALLLLNANALADGYPESDHPYADNADVSWTYTHPGNPDYIKVTFSSDTAFENNYDKLAIADVSGSTVTCTGDMLSGATLCFKGDTLTLRLTSDGSVNRYGFRITAIEPATREEFDQPRYRISNGVITYYTGGGSDVTIPAEIDGQAVTGIGSRAFSGNAYLRSVTIPKTVKSLGTYAFTECPSLETVTFEAGSALESIGSSAFRDCAALTGINIPAGVTTQGQYTFYNCSALKTVTFAPESRLTEIGSAAFNGCEDLTDIEIPAGVSAIGYAAFDGCSALKTVTFAPDSRLTTIGSYAFRNCAALDGIEIPAGVTALGQYVFYNCSALKTATFEAGSALTSIGDYAFMNCAALTGIEIPAGVTALEKYVFYNCGALKTVTFAPESRLTAIGSCAFTRCAKLTDIEIPAGVTAIGAAAFADCIALKTVTFSPDSALTEIGNSAFDTCKSLQEVVLPDTVVSLGDSAFSLCSDLRHVTIPAGVSVLPDYAFWLCSKLETLTFKGDGIALERCALYRCDALTEIGVPITGIVDSSVDFGSYSAIRAIEFADSVPALSDELIETLLKPLNLVVTVGRDSPIYPQLKEAGVCYRVRETGETNFGSLPTTTLRGKVEEVVRECVTDDMSDYEKALALHDWLVKNADYDDTYTYYDPDGVLLKGSGVCQSYATAYSLLLDKVGIENDYEYGDDHIWNMVKLGDNWYHIDVTWDDIGDTSYYEFFGLATRAIEQVGSHECYSRSHEADAYEYYYWYHNGAMDTAIAENTAAIAAALDAGQVSVKCDAYIINERGNKVTWYRSLAPMLGRVLEDGSYTMSGRPVKLSFDWKYGNPLYATLVMNEPDLRLPTSLTAVEDSAFEGMNAAVVSVPDGVSRIGARAFANCDALWQIEIPPTVTDIADDAFAGDAGVMIFGEAGSAAETFAQAHGYSFVQR